MSNITQVASVECGRTEICKARKKSNKEDEKFVPRETTLHMEACMAKINLDGCGSYVRRRQPFTLEGMILWAKTALLEAQRDNGENLSVESHPLECCVSEASVEDYLRRRSTPGEQA
ncbi:hypothetical protein Ancab_031986 [Ancistrocladus abbreviatus]